jgi:hypothetical protein
MKLYNKNSMIRAISIVTVCILFLISCEKFVNPDQALVIKDEEFFKNWQEYRSAEMGIYTLQQNLVEQIVVLGELRADLVGITGNATSDLIEVNNFQMTSNNEFGNPINFFKLIAGCNNLARKLEEFHPEVLVKDAALSNYDYLYGEVRCMLAWTYFNAVRIYEKVPYVPSSLTSINEISEFIESGGHFVDSVDIIFPPNGLPEKGDTLLSEPINYEGYSWLDMRAVIDMFTRDLEENVKAVGVNHWIENGDQSWDVVIWNESAMHCLLGQMYLYEGDYVQAEANFRHITEFRQLDSDGAFFRYALDNKLSGSRWKNMHSGIDLYEHILALPFDKSNQQKNDLQYYFSIQPPNKFYMKPTPFVVYLWEGIWQKYLLEKNNANPELTYFREFGRYDNHIRGVPGDFDRGQGVSYAYMREGSSEPMENTSLIESSETVEFMLELKRDRKDFEIERLMERIDTVVYKYSIGKGPYDHDAFFTIYRAASIHLYMAEIHARWRYYEGGLAKDPVIMAQKFLNDGDYLGNPAFLGVRGRVGDQRTGGFGEGDWKVTVENDIIYRHDPFTNELIFPPINLQGDLMGKQEYLVDKIIEERARELAFEGERFYDLMRIAKRRGEPEYLAIRVASKFVGGSRATELLTELLSARLTKEKYESLYLEYLAGTEAGEIYSHLLNEGNWYIDFKWQHQEEESNTR